MPDDKNAIEVHLLKSRTPGMAATFPPSGPGGPVPPLRPGLPATPGGPRSPGAPESPYQQKENIHISILSEKR